MTSFVDRVATRALTIRPARLLLSILAAPFYVVGWVVGIVVLACSFAYAAVLVGVHDARRARPERDTT